MIVSLIVGALAGWLAGVVMKGSGFGALVNIILGLIGGIVGRLAFGLLGFSSHTLLSDIVVSFVGSVIVVWLVGQLNKK